MEGMDELYRKEADKCLRSIKESLSRLDKNSSDMKAIDDLSRFSHTLKGSSLQMGFFSVAYLARSMEDLANKVMEKKIKLDKNNLAFLTDFTKSLEKALIYETKNKKYPVNKKLFEKLDRLLKE